MEEISSQLASLPRFPELCGDCDRAIFGDGAEPYSHQPPSNTVVSCTLCRLIKSMKDFVQGMKIEPFRSYRLRVFRLVNDRKNVLPSADPHSYEEARIGVIVKLSSNEYLFEEQYTENKKIFPHKDSQDLTERWKYVATDTVRRFIEFYAQLPQSSLGLGRSARLNLKPANSASVIYHVSNLMQNCRENHSLCQVMLSDAGQSDSREIPQYPIRLIQVSQSESGTKARLIELRENLPAYVTLSHRWYGNQQWKTRQSNFSACLVDLPIREFPQTFQDAIAFAMEIGIYCLWIDSICIIQDQIEDWEQQSAQIGRIFERSVCTLAAIDAFVESGMDRGLFLTRDTCPTKVSIASSFVTEYKGSLGETPSTSTTRSQGFHDHGVDMQALSDSTWTNSSFTLASQHTNFEMSVEWSPWNTRGWILQERLLSTRILYFTKEQVFWECAHGIYPEHTQTGQGPEESQQEQDKEQSTSEFYATTNGRVHRRLRLQKQDHLESIQLSKDENNPAYFDTWDEHTRLGAWWLIIRRYSECSLTFTRDRWLAIKGLCDVLQQQYKSKIYAGIWVTGVGACLLWHARSHPLQPFPDFNAPTWSWLTLDGPITNAYEDESYTGYVQKVLPLIQDFSFASVASIAHRGSGSASLTYGFSGSLTLTCPIAPAVVSGIQFKDFHFREETGQAADASAFQFFRDISDGKSQLELAREYRSVDLPPMTRLLFTSDYSRDADEASGAQGNRTGRAIGWVVLDREILPYETVTCAAIVSRILYGNGNVEQHIIECIVLTKYVQGDSTKGNHPGPLYQRIGRARIVEKGCIESFHIGKIRIV